MMSVLRQNKAYGSFPPTRYCIHSSDNLKLDFLLSTSDVVGITVHMTVASLLHSMGFFRNRLLCKGSTLTMNISTCGY